MDGKQLWKEDLGLLDSGYYVVPEAQWEFGSSPIIYQNMVLVQCDVLKGSFVAAFNIKDGSRTWYTARDDVPTWGTPTIYDDGKRAQMIINGYKHIVGYDAKTGMELWRLKGGGDIPVPTPIVAHDLVFITNAHGSMAPIFAIRLNATGDISLKGDETSNQYVAWSVPRDGAYMITPLVYGDYLYSCKNNGVLSCYEAKSGKRVYQERLGNGTTGFTSSPVAGDGKIYFSSEDGDIYVVKAGPNFEILSKNSMGAVCMASPAISAGVIYFRTQSQLVAVSSLSRHESQKLNAGAAEAKGSRNNKLAFWGERGGGCGPPTAAPRRAAGSQACNFLCYPFVRSTSLGDSSKMPSYFCASPKSEGAENSFVLNRFTIRSPRPLR